MKKLLILSWLALILGLNGLAGQQPVIADLPFAHQPHRSEPGFFVDLALDLYLPSAGGGWPVVVLCHGGSYVGGDKGDFRGLAVALARSGIAAVSINYRLGMVPDAGTETEAVSMVYDDVRQAFAWIAANAGRYGLDPDRVYISGGSSGGHLTIATAILYPLEARHSVRLRGAIDLYGGYFTERISSRATPLLIIQGTDDKACLPEASRYMAGLYAQAGAWCRMFLVEGMVHDWGGARYMDKIVARMAEFIAWTGRPDWPGPEAMAANHSEQFVADAILP